MFRHILIAIILSVIAILCLNQIGFFLHYLVMTHRFIDNLFAKIISGSFIADILRAALALFLIPFIVAIIPTLVYRLIAKREFYYFPHVFWLVWVMLLAVLA